MNNKRNIIKELKKESKKNNNLDLSIKIWIALLEGEKEQKRVIREFIKKQKRGVLNECK